MEYVEIKIKVPKNYEQQVMEVALRKVEAIISQLVLSPTQAKKDEYNLKVVEAYSVNKVTK